VSGRPASFSMRVGSAGHGFRPPLMGLFHRYHAGEQDVVFEVNVLVQIVFKVCQRFVQSLEADAGIARRRVSDACWTHSAQGIPRGIVFMLHHVSASKAVEATCR